MKYLFLFILSFIISVVPSYSQGYKIGDKALDFKLKNIDGKELSLNSIKNAKGYVVVFTCNHCPYAIAYQDRLIQLDKKYKSKGYPVVAINPNDPTLSPGDSYDEMIKRAKEKQFTFPYLFDEKQEIYKIYGAKRTPHVYVLKKDDKDLIVKYIGTIDDNYKDEAQVKETFLANALENLIQGKDPEPSVTKAIGCTIKDKQYVP
jgi:peroxiredoxin